MSGIRLVDVPKEIGAKLLEYYNKEQYITLDRLLEEMKKENEKIIMKKTLKEMPKESKEELIKSIDERNKEYLIYGNIDNETIIGDDEDCWADCGVSDINKEIIDDAIDDIEEIPQLYNPETGEYF